MDTIGKQYTFWNLINCYKIIVPKIQRDYIQGRENKTVEKNREEFVKELIDSLVWNKPMSLNFVYGTIHGDEFIPIDGQQRLTTLFLLHLYVFAKKENAEAIKKLQDQFSYQTRYTTNRFLEKLSEEFPKMLNSSCRNDNLTDIIRDSGWYVAPWDNDPNIRSCLVMLQTIHETCNDIFANNNDGISKFFNLLTGADCPITFMWLQLPSSFGSDNQLYIRMNSRGKQLTDFENFKAELYEKVLTDEDDLAKNFKKKIDGDWYSMLWDLNVVNDIEKKARLTDALFKRLIHWTIVCVACAQPDVKVQSGRKSGRRKRVVSEVVDESERSKKEKRVQLYRFCTPEGTDILRCDVQQYEEIFESHGVKDIKDILKDFNNLLEFLCQIKKEKVFQFIEKDILKISVDKKGIDFTIDEYKPRVLYFSILQFVRFNGREEDSLNNFKSWYRVILNLVSTQEIDSPEDFQRALRAIAEWKGGNMKDWLEESCKSAFRSAQIEEEKKKLGLIESSEKWKDAILEAERTNFDSCYCERDYFRGQIGFLLHMANNDLSKFNFFSSAVRCIFNDENYWTDCDKDAIGNDPGSADKINSEQEASFDNLFHRAMLTKKNYWCKAAGSDSNIRTFYVYNERHNNFDWRGAFRNKDSVAVSCLQSLLEDYCKKNGDEEFDFEKFKNVLTMAVSNYSETDANPENKLRCYLIEKPSWFKYIKSNYYVYWDESNSKYLLMRLKLKRDGSTFPIKDYIEAKK